jgi:putative transposase
MPRKARLDTPGALHHVMIRGLERRKIFWDDEDRGDFLARVAQLVKKSGDRIVAWTLMENHVHFLLFSGPLGLPTFMRRLLTGYAGSFNRRHGRSGHLFQNRYKSIVCEEEAYLLELVRYIHLNPLRASVVKTLGELDIYPWSGHRILVGKNRNDWQERDYILRQFGKREGKAVQGYRKFVEEGIRLGRRPELVGGGLIRSLGGWSRVMSLRDKGGKVEHDCRILGGGEFVQSIMQEANEQVKRQMKNKRKERGVAGVIEKLCKEAGIEETELREGGRRRKVSEVRGRIALFLCREMGIPMAEIARQVGVGTSAIGMAIRKEEGRVI